MKKPNARPRRGNRFTGLLPLVFVKLPTSFSVDGVLFYLAALTGYAGVVALLVVVVAVVGVVVVCDVVGTTVLSVSLFLNRV